MKCQQCGAPIPAGSYHCAFCGVELPRPPGIGALLAIASVLKGPARLKGLGEFGYPGTAPLVLGLIGAAIVYALGWAFEDTKYWLEVEAVIIWSGVLPLWLCGLSLLTRLRWHGWKLSIAVALTIFTIHLTVMSAFRGRINDDYVGIAALFAGAALLGWWIGRGVHELIRRRRARAGMA